MKILMVCLGNICRSPMAQGIMEALIREKGLDWVVDSAGTNGFHDGETPDPRAIRESMTRGISIKHQISRKIKLHDFEYFDLILTMDLSNRNYCLSLVSDPKLKDKIQLIMDYAQDTNFNFVPDPYYDNRFDLAFDLIEKACHGVIAKFNKS
ncbi:MAG: low molecular weight phosphotyrosine protein phosphatase [Saprospiraceae bacterium]|nr:low molecular weight phosphotyrosine protein phosphatase [Candidatus Defluviibacterium haderslevense]MBK7242763.1 low molecular weight phosphotyrosine protein phosphatase [Candidatus Defluviibacterium haderslevense]